MKFSNFNRNPIVQQFHTWLKHFHIQISVMFKLFFCCFLCDLIFLQIFTALNFVMLVSQMCSQIIAHKVNILRRYLQSLNRFAFSTHD